MTVPAVNRAPKALDPRFPTMQFRCVWSMNPTYLVNIDFFQAPHPKFVSQALCTVYSPQASDTVDVTSVILFRHDKAPCRATEDIIQQFSHLMTNRLNLMCRVTGVHVLTHHSV